jgi:hypothetical protein
MAVTFAGDKSPQALRAPGDAATGAEPEAGAALEVGAAAAPDAVLALGGLVAGPGGGRQPTIARAVRRSAAIADRRSVAVRLATRPRSPCQRPGTLPSYLVMWTNGRRGRGADQGVRLPKITPSMLFALLLATTTKVSVQFCFVLVTSLKAAAIMVWRGPKLIEDSAESL